MKLARCVNHPHRKTAYECMKYQIGMCEDCLDCRDPDIYCKFRESCTIWQIKNAETKKS
ncbi:MAG: hypothetical protein KAS40_01315 [Desulfobacterales bacterium]|nr:hypothetical protein [Desulfobacterales bacterium]